MRALKILAKVVIIVTTIFIFGGFLIPAEWVVTRSTTIHASPEQIYSFVGNFKEWEKWSPWNSSKDATLKYTYSGPEIGEGAKQSWIGDEMGKGWMEFTSANPQTGVAYKLFIDMGSSQSTIHGNIDFQAEGEATKVTWTDKGNSGKNFAKRWLSVLIKIMLTKEIDTGLADLKAVVEKA